MMKTILITAMLAMLQAAAFSQKIAIDRGVKAGTLWCFPAVDDSLRFYYLPSGAKLATTENGAPGFSFLRYNTLKKNTSDRTISEAGGGAVLHFLVTCGTPEEVLRKAEAILRKKLTPGVKIAGPIIFKSARYALVSSTLNADSTRQIKTGEAPVLENSKLAFSFGLIPKDAQILLESFKTGTADLSVVFDFTFEGLSDAYQAKLEVNWEKTSRQLSESKDTRLFTLGLDVKNEVDSLLRNDAIRLMTSGENRNMEALTNRVYNKIVDLLYEPVINEIPAEKPAMEESSTDLLPQSVLGLIRETGNIFPVSLNRSYRQKALRTEGTAVYDFNARANVAQHHFVTFNIGDIYQQHGADASVFRDVSLDDQPFRQREISINVDGSVEKDLAKMVNLLTITVRKTHQDSSQTVREVSVNKASFGSVPMVSYLNQKDTDPLQWLEFEYRITWFFAEGSQFSTDWVKTNAPVISVVPPYKRWKVSFSGDIQKLSQNVAAISIEVPYQFHGQPKSERITIKPPENPEEKNLEITVPADLSEIDYEITWIMRDGSRLSRRGKDRHGLLFIDQLPVH